MGSWSADGHDAVRSPGDPSRAEDHLRGGMTSSPSIPPGDRDPPGGASNLPEGAWTLGSVGTLGHLGLGLLKGDSAVQLCQQTEV